MNNSEKIKKVLKTTYNKIKKLKGGKNAQYIPELAKVNPKIYGITICTCDGKTYSIGDFKEEVAIESVSKVFTLAIAFETSGIKNMEKKIGFHDSCMPFNSIIASEISESHTINPFVNAGAMATTSLLYKKDKDQFWRSIHNNLNNFAGRKLKISKKIYESESETNQHNKALAYLLKSHDRFYGDVESSVDVYTKQGSVLVSSEDIARMASVFANNGLHPKTKKKVISKKYIPYILSMMIGGGVYQKSDKWMVEVGLPAKSGVGGALMCVVPGVMGIGIVSPPLDNYGNSYKGVRTAKMLSEKLNLNMLVKSSKCS